MSKITDKQFISKSFTLPTLSICHIDSGSMFFDIVDNKKPNLLVTIGDSWTWGTELNNRLDECFGNQLSKNLSADWLNLGLPGIGNHYISTLYNELCQVANTFKNSYDKIYCVVTFTESAREFNGCLDRKVDYASQLKTIKQPSDYDKFIDFIEHLTLDNCNVNNSNMQTVFAYNFVANKYNEYLPGLLDKTWLEVCLEHSSIKVDNNCNIRSPFVFEKLHSVFDIEWSLDKTIFQQWILDRMKEAEQCYKLLSDCTYFHKDYHPNKLGHQLWADYLYTEFKR